MTKYRFATLTHPGDSFTIPEGSSRASVRSAASQYAKRHGIRLRIVGDRVFMAAPAQEQSQ